jgi:hypothetical protein
MARRPRPTPARPDGRLGRRPPLEGGRRDRRPSLFDTGEPRQETPLAGMSAPDHREATGELRHDAAFIGERPEIEQKARRPVVAAGISALDLDLGVLPNAFAAAKNLITPDTTAFPGPLLALPFLGVTKFGRPNCVETRDSWGRPWVAIAVGSSSPPTAAGGPARSNPGVPPD